ncbi:MAG: radical SAM protein [Candidatus Methanoperedens sp.]|nr:radical SAM protein [Candidatus Methanoperedens sp.]MCZ7395190.1 radical SAM protein [Candidatus Methanoperedens sp.]
MKLNGNLILPRYSSFNVYKNNSDYFIINPEVNFWFKLSKEQFLAFKLLDGESTVDKLLNKINGHVAESLRGACIKFIEEIALNYPTKCIELPKTTSLSTMYLALTNKCNSNCLYCFRDLNASNRIDGYSTLDKNLINNAILSFRNIAVANPEIVYTGGEPTLFPELIEIANFAKKNNIENVLQTNGLLINENNASLYAEIFDKIQISLDSTNEEVNDWLRGKRGHFKTIKRAIAMLCKYDVKIKLAATITKKNFNDISNIKKYFPEIDFQFTPMLQIGKGKEMSHLAFSPHEFLEHLVSLPEGSEALFAKNIPEFGTKNQMCGAGTSILSISPNGDVFPCQMLHHQDFHCGNIKNDSLENIYHSSGTIERFRTLTVDKIDGCKECDIRYICAGGCMANGFWLNNDFPVKDYFCEFNKELSFYNLISKFKEINLTNNN